MKTIKNILFIIVLVSVGFIFLISSDSSMSKQQGKFYKQNKQRLHRPNVILVCFLTNMFSAGKNFEQFTT